MDGSEQQLDDLDQVERIAFDLRDPSQEAASKARQRRILVEATESLAESARAEQEWGLLDGDAGFWQAFAALGSDPLESYDLYDALIGNMLGDAQNGTFTLLFLLYDAVGFGADARAFALEDAGQLLHRSQPWLFQQLLAASKREAVFTANSDEGKSFVDETMTGLARQGLQVAAERLYRFPAAERLRYLCHIDAEAGRDETPFDSPFLVACRDAWRALALDESGGYRNFSPANVRWPEANVLAEAWLQPFLPDDEPAEVRLLTLASAMKAIDPDSLRRFKSLVPEHRLLEGHEAMLDWWEQA